MAAIHSSKVGEATRALGAAELLAGCFYCLMHLGGVDVLVYWHGTTGTIWLHTHCAEQLAMRLFHDAQQVPRPADAWEPGDGAR